MAEYINKQDALGVFHDWSNKEGELVSAKETSEYKAIENIQAADVVDVVRCKDCVHRPSRIPGASDDHEGLNLEFPDDWCPMQCEDGWYNRMPGDDFFCGYGERKEKDNG